MMMTIPNSADIIKSFSTTISSQPTNAVLKTMHDALKVVPFPMEPP